MDLLKIEEKEALFCLPDGTKKVVSEATTEDLNKALVYLFESEDVSLSEDADSKSIANPAQRIVFEHPELFGWAGIFSGSLVIQDDEVDYRDILLNPEAFKRRFHMLFVACGTQDSLYETTKANEKKVLEAGVSIDTFEEYGYHDWTFWRHCANLFLRKLFK